MTMSGWVIVAVASAAIAQTPSGGLAQVEILQRTLADVAEAVRPSVVAIRAVRPLGAERGDEQDDGPDRRPTPGSQQGEQPEEQLVPSVGSGFVIDAEGLVLTNEHVIHRARPEDVTCILSDGESYRAIEINSDPRRDLAVIRIEASGLIPASLGDADEVRQGHFAIVMGNPFGSAAESHGRPAMSFGIISALGRGLTRQLDPTMNQRYYGNLIQTDARINPGNSGGPLLNIKGQVIGINTAISTRSGGSEGMGYAIPMNRHTRQVIVQLAHGEEVEYGFLGVGLRSLTAIDREENGIPALTGAVVESVEAGTPAAVAGLQVSDVVVAIEGEVVEDADGLIRIVGGLPIGASASLKFYRGTTEVTVHFVPARRKMPPPNHFTWRGMKLAYPDWDVCRTFNLPVDIRGAVVVEIEAGSPADRAGVRKGQVLQKLGEASVHGIRRLPRIAQSLNGQVIVTLLGTPPVQLTVP